MSLRFIFRFCVVVDHGSRVSYNKPIAFSYPYYNKLAPETRLTGGVTLKVIHLISGGDTGGAKTHVHSLLKNLSRGMDITLVCFRDGPFAQEAAELGIETRVCEGGFFSALRQVRRMIAEEGFDLVHTHGSRANLAGAILRSTCGRPVVSTVHSDYRLDYMGRPLAAATYGVLNVLALRRIKYHVGVSDAMRDLLISRGFPRETTFAIYNGLDFSREPQAAGPRRVLPARLRQRRAGQHSRRRGGEAGPGQGPRHAGARLCRGEKDQPGAAAHHRGRGPGASCTRGSGPRARRGRRRLPRRLAGRHGGVLLRARHKHAQFPLGDLPLRHHRGRVLFPPTVASAVGGHPRLIEDGKTGYLFTPGDWKTLAERLSALCRRRRSCAAAWAAPCTSARRASSPSRPPAASRRPCTRRYSTARRTAAAASWSAAPTAWGNSGDEAILDAIVAELRSIDPLMPVTVMTRDPAGASARLGLTAVHTFNFPRFLAVMRRPGALSQRRRQPHPGRHQPPEPLVLPLHPARGQAPRLQGHDVRLRHRPVKRPGGVAKTRKVLNSCVDAITLREPDSIEELARFGVTEPEIILASDPALTLPAAPAEEVDAALRAVGADPDGKYICFALRLWPGFDKKRASLPPLRRTPGRNTASQRCSCP